jgi:hypothetical protein
MPASLEPEVANQPHQNAGGAVVDTGTARGLYTVDAGPLHKRGNAMHELIRITAVLLIAGFLGGCAMPGAVVANATTADELLMRLGQPTDKRVYPQGGEFWEYAYGPEGTETWLFGIDQGRMVRSSEQLLSEERLRRIMPGKTTESEVRALLGKPGDITRYREETAWEWRARIGPDMGVYVVRFGADGRAIQYGVLKDYTTDP